MTSKDLRSINTKIAIVRLDSLALTQREIGKRLGVSAKYVSKVLIRAGKRRKHKVEKNQR